jgi:hypothetical protein
MWTKKVTQWGPGTLIQLFVFLSWTKHANTHTGCQEPQGDHMNSLPLDTEITSLWSEKYIGTTRYCLGMLRFL